MYKGESDRKKMARLWFWQQVANELGANFLKSKHMYLASAEGGDASVLLGLGVRPQNHVAVEMDPAAALNFSRKFPQIQVHVGAVDEIAKKHMRQCGSVFLDFCGYVSREMARTTAWTATRALKDFGVLGVGMMRGREKDMGPIDKWRDARERARGRATDEELSTAIEAHESTYDRIRQRGRKAGKVRIIPGPRSDARLDLLESEINMITNSMGQCVVRTAELYYHSSTDNIGGVPMVYAIHSSIRKHGASARSLANTMHTIRADAVERFVKASDPKRTNEEVRALRSKTVAVWAHGMASYSGEVVGCCLRDLAMELDGLDGVAPTLHMLLNIPKGRLSAWRAHRTRRVSKAAA